jgi:hypothetical protein
MHALSTAVHTSYTPTEADYQDSQQLHSYSTLALLSVPAPASVWSDLNKYNAVCSDCVHAQSSAVQRVRTCRLYIT